MPETHNHFYVTTPIYYVNDRPHIGHVYTTTLADVLARYHRLAGDPTFFLTGTDEHATKVVDAAAERNITTQAWADQNAAVFEQTFGDLDLSNDDFIRTSQARHKQRVLGYIQKLIDRGDVYEGEYEGWYDAGQEEYVPENKAKEYNHQSPINGKPLIRKTEKNYFFRLSQYQQPLLQLLNGESVHGHRFDVQPAARKNEVVARIREGLNDVPVSRTGMGDWGIKIPGDQAHTIYVWIDALFNYYSAIDTDDRRTFWPADVHLIGKDILWFHAVIWPALLMALEQPLPQTVYAHSWWVKETNDDSPIAKKVSKSLGNLVTLEELDQLADLFSLDAVRWYLATQGPLGATDATFSDTRFVDIYNSDLANTLGNSFSRVTNMTHRYFDGILQPPGEAHEGDLGASLTDRAASAYQQAMARLDLAGAGAVALGLIREVDGFIERTAPFKLAKEPSQQPRVGQILYQCAETIRIASVMLWPFMPQKMQSLWDNFQLAYGQPLAENGTGDLAAWLQWGGLREGTHIAKTDPLFPRYQPAKESRA